MSGEIRVGNSQIKPLGTKQATSLGSAVLLSAATGISSIPTGANACKLQAEGANIRYTDDGSTDPTTAVGIRLIMDAPAEWYVGDLSKLKIIQESATAKLNVSFYQIG